MRRPLLLMFAASALLALGAATSAADAGTASKRSEIAVAAIFRDDGFTVSFFADSEDHDLQLFITKGAQFASYTVPMKIDRRSLRASFGGLGSLKLRFKPADAPPTDCSAPVSPVGRRLTGSFDFTGERGYIEIDRSSVGGKVTLVPNPACGDEKPRRARASQADDVAPESEATLKASTPSEGAKPIRYLFVGGRRGGLLPDVTTFGGLIEHRGAMRVQRGGETKGGVFRWDPDQGTATVTPPAPFTGSADFLHQPGETPMLSGSLEVAILGGDPVRLTGPDFTQIAFHHRLYD